MSTRTNATRAALLAAAMTLFSQPMMADSMLITDFNQTDSAGDWRFFTDQVMGGVSTGSAQVIDGALVLSGRVSTQNNGGFIQARRGDVTLPADATSLRLRTRGDGQTYYLHIRTKSTRLPWQYYQAAFTAPENWSEIDIPLSEFRASGVLLPKRVKPTAIRSIALVAYGRDHDANVSLSTIWTGSDQ